ncbi:MAG: MBL fold metallo-hydrolase [Lachnospiraceae bacterium]|nr:MBL fold metallo-hydrolase [Lachnospiraceae bacterium]
MKIRILRGTNQIGGSSVIITTQNAKIVMDFGSELNDNPQKLEVDGLTSGKSDIDTVFFSHNHGDHVGLIDTINNDIPIYMGKTSLELLKMFAERTKERQYTLKTLDRVKTFEKKEKIVIKDIVVTPYFVDHSAFDAYMFLVEAEGKKILYTGDFRDHGFIGKGFEPVLQNHVGKVDAVICEGTTLNRDDSKTLTEMELQREIGKVINSNKYVFVMCASTNIFRIEGICSAVKDGKCKLSDKYQSGIINYIKENYKDVSYLYCNSLSEYNENDKDKYEKYGFVMFIRQGKYFKKIMDEYKDAKIIYSMWHGYLDKKNGDDRETLRDFFGNREIIELHTSGHATKGAIKKLIDITSPNHVIPIHTEAKKKFRELAGDKLLLANDNEDISI